MKDGMKSQDGRMKAADAPVPCPRASFTPHPSSGSARSAFTLTEILVVIGIIVLMLAMAVPAFNYMTGARSIEAAENTMSAMLARARAEALRHQQPRGIVFFEHPRTERATMALVHYVGGNDIDLVPERDFQPLQPGVAVRFMNYARNGVILFDGRGRLASDSYVIRQTGQGNLGTLLNLQADESSVAQFGLMLADRQVLRNQQDERAWLDQNAATILVNRYNGTLIRGE